MIKNYTYKLKTNKTIERKFLHRSGMCTFAYNCSKDLSEQSYKKVISLSAFDITNPLVLAQKESP
ncbi:helix-turn-helix domain-containing protein [Flavobacterium oncorhynchi]|uniref:helix-turn-helix domain-containing protein n=1 Tax=Flavobacterium oncorhynchi TaxID=728056 RepID=UPI003F7FEEA1